MNTTTRGLTTKSGTFKYVRTEQRATGAEYVMRYQGHPSNGVNAGKLYLLRPWCSRPDFYRMVSYNDQVCQCDGTFRKNPTTGKIEDVTDRMGGDEIEMNRDHEATHGVLYYRSPRTFDGVPLEYVA